MINVNIKVKKTEAIILFEWFTIIKKGVWPDLSWILKKISISQCDILTKEINCICDILRRNKESVSVSFPSLNSNTVVFESNSASRNLNISALGFLFNMIKKERESLLSNDVVKNGGKQNSMTIACKKDLCVIRNLLQRKMIKDENHYMDTKVGIELRIFQIIQKNLLPVNMEKIGNWQYIAHYNNSDGNTSFYMFDRLPKLTDAPNFINGICINRDDLKKLFVRKLSIDEIANALKDKSLPDTNQTQLDDTKKTLNTNALRALFNTDKDDFSIGTQAHLPGSNNNVMEDFLGRTGELKLEKKKRSPQDDGFDFSVEGGGIFEVPMHKAPEVEVLRKYVDALLKITLPFDFTNIIVIMRGHSLEVTYRLIEALLKLGVLREQMFYGDKLYSTNKGVFESIRKKFGINVVPGVYSKCYGDHIKSGFLSSQKLLAAVKEKISDLSAKKFIVIDDGGILRQIITKDKDFKNVPLITIEQTSGGIGREDGSTAVINVAQSFAKELETFFIACAFYEKCKERLKKVNNGAIAVIASEGRIGSKVVQLALQDGYMVYAYDPRKPKNPIINSKFKHVNSFAEAIRQCDVVMVCTGKDVSVDFTKLSFEKDVLFCSSNCGTFYKWIKDNRIERSIHEIYRAKMSEAFAFSQLFYALNGKTLISIANAGAAVNFDRNPFCIKAEEIVITMMQLLNGFIQAGFMFMQDKNNYKGVFQLSPVLQEKTVKLWWNSIKKMVYDTGEMPLFVKQFFNGDMIKAEKCLQQFWDLKQIEKKSLGEKLSGIEKQIIKTCISSLEKFFADIPPDKCYLQQNDKFNGKLKSNPKKNR